MILRVRIIDNDGERYECLDGISRLSTIANKNKNGTTKRCTVQFTGLWNGKITEVGIDDVTYDKGQIKVICYGSNNFHLE